MQAAGVHSALAIKRQRKRRDEQRRAKERRYSSHSVAGVSQMGSHHSMGSHRNSIGGHIPSDPLSTKVCSTITTFHLGVVFTILGLFMVVSSLIPDYLNNDWGELLGTGIVFLVIGVFLIVINRVVTQKEEDKLTEYLETKLSRSRSGQLLVRDAESGAMRAMPRHVIKSPQSTPPLSPRSPSDDQLMSPSTLSPPQPQYFSNGPASPHKLTPLEPPLERILEESEMYKFNGNANHRKFSGSVDTSNGSTASLSPSTPTETQGLLYSHRGNRHVDNV